MEETTKSTEIKMIEQDSVWNGIKLAIFFIGGVYLIKYLSKK